jgi:PST family polysaccharide transporter
LTSTPQRPLNQRIALGTIWIVAARIFVRSLGLLSTLVLARLLVPEDFGLVAIGITMMQLLSNFTDIGVSQTVVKFRKSDTQFLNTLFTISAIRGLLVCAILILTAFLADSFYDDPRTFWVFLGVSIIPVFNGLANPKFHEFERDLDFSKKFKLQAIAKISSVIVAISIAVIYQSFWAIIASIIVGTFIEMVLSYVLQPYRPTFKLSHDREIFSFMGWLTGVSFVVALNNKLDTLLLPRLTSTAATGAYYVGYQLVDLATVETTTPIASAIYPGLSEQQDQTSQMRKTFLQGVEVLGAIGLPIAFGVAFIAEDIVQLLLGDGWDDVVTILQICTPFEGLLMLFVALQGYAVARGLTKYILFREVIYFAIRMPLFIWAALTYGLVGAAVATAAGTFVKWLINMQVYQHTSGGAFWEPVWQVRRSIIASVSMAAYFFFVKHHMPLLEDLPIIFRMIFDIMAGAAFYSAAHLLAWHMEGRPRGVEKSIFGFLGWVRQKLAGAA